jgi:hypothetical protein
MKFVTNLDLNQNQLINGTFEVLASDPSTNLFDGRLIFNSTEGVIKVYDATASAWRKMITGVTSAGSQSSALTINESNGTISITANLATSASAGLMSASDFSKLADATSEDTASKLVIRDASSQAKFGTPTDPAHAATKGYVDAARSGLDVKQSVRAATTGTVNLSTDVDNGSIIDGVTLATGNRILIKDQGGVGVAHVDNGIYTVNASGAPTRATDFDSSDEVTPGAFTFVEEGTANGDAGFVVATNGSITVGSTAILFTQFSGTGQITAGAGLSKDGSTLNVNYDDVTIYVDANDKLAVKSSSTAGQVLVSNGSGSASWGALNLDDSDAVTGTLAVANGGTNASTASAARTNLAETTAGTTSTPVLARIAKQGCAASSGGVSTTTVTHNFGTTDVIVGVYEVSTGATVIADVTRSNGNTVSVVINGTVTANDYTIVVTG